MALNGLGEGVGISCLGRSPRNGANVEVGAGRHFGQNVTATPHRKILLHPSSLLCPNHIRGKPTYRELATRDRRCVSFYSRRLVEYFPIADRPRSTGNGVRPPFGAKRLAGTFGRGFIDHRATDRAQLLCPPAWRGRFSRRRSALLAPPTPRSRFGRSQGQKTAGRESVRVETKGVSVNRQRSVCP